MYVRPAVTCFFTITIYGADVVGGRFWWPSLEKQENHKLFSQKQHFKKKKKICGKFTYCYLLHALRVVKKKRNKKKLFLFIYSFLH